MHCVRGTHIWILKFWFLDETDNKYEMMNECYLEAMFTLLPCMIGENKWEQLGQESQGDFEKMVTRTDEGLLLWALDCYWNVVTISDKFKMTSDNRPRNNPYYISEGNSTRKNQGWTELGKQRYNEICGLVREWRKDEYWYNEVWKNNFRSRWVASYRYGRKSSEKSTGLPEDQVVSVDDL